MIHTHNASYRFLRSTISHPRMRKSCTHLNVSGTEPTESAIEIFLLPFETKWYSIWKYKYPIDFLVDQLQRANSSPALKYLNIRENTKLRKINRKGVKKLYIPP